MTKLLKPRGFKMQDLCSQTIWLLRCVSLERHPWIVMELHLQRHQLTISPSKWTGVGLTVLVTLLYLDTERAMWHSALTHTWKIKLYLHSCEHAHIWVLNPHVDLGALFCSAKSTQLAEELGGMAAMHSRILQFGLIYSPKTENLCQQPTQNNFSITLESI